MKILNINEQANDSSVIVLAAPVVLTVIGFGVKGVAAKSFASGAQSYFYKGLTTGMGLINYGLATIHSL